MRLIFLFTAGGSPNCCAPAWPQEWGVGDFNRYLGMVDSINCWHVVCCYALQGWPTIVHVHKDTRMGIIFHFRMLNAPREYLIELLEGRRSSNYWYLHTNDRLENNNCFLIKKKICFIFPFYWSHELTVLIWLILALHSLTRSTAAVSVPPNANHKVKGWPFKHNMGIGVNSIGLTQKNNNIVYKNHQLLA